MAARQGAFRAGLGKVAGPILSGCHNARQLATLSPPTPWLYSSRVKAMARVVALLLVTLTCLAACGNSGDVAQIKAVIEKGNHEQEDAFAAHDPTLMQDTHTARDFAYMVRTNESLDQEGAVGIRMMKLEWGNIQFDSASSAEAETWETWEETDQDGNTASSRDRNVYRLLKVGSEWKIDQVAYPDKQDQPSDQPSIPSLQPASP
jgi:hypothetical protein